MYQINPNAVLVIAFATVLGALAGSTLAGAAVGLGVVLVATVVGR